MQIKKAPQKILVIQTAFIGDVVFTSPLIHAIKQAYPDSQVLLLVRPKAQEVAACVPGVDQVMTFDKDGEECGPWGLWKVARKIRQAKVDLLIAPHHSARTALLSRLSMVPMRIGHRQGLGRLVFHLAVPSLPAEPSMMLQDLNLLAEAGIAVDGTRLRLGCPEDKQGYIDAFYAQHDLESDGPLAALCVGAFWPTKRWPAVYFASLSEWLVAQGIRPVLFGGPDERSVAEEITAILGRPLVSCVGNSLAESAALLKKCWVAVGSDSGLTHMARALAVPSIMIFGPTDSRAHAFGPECTVLTAQVKCRPCSPHGPRVCPQKHHDCMRLVSPEHVIDAIKAMAKHKAPLLESSLIPFSAPRPVSLPTTG